MVKVKWQSSAKEDLRQIYHYYCYVKQSASVALNMKDAMFSAARDLENFPELGARELSLSHADVCFRYLVVWHHYKMIYFHEADVCHIVAIWDCRNNPNKLDSIIELI